MDATELIGEAVELYEDIEVTSLRLAHSANLSVRDRLRCMNTAMRLRQLG